MKHWTEEFFIKKCRLWLDVMNHLWDTGKRDAENILKMFKEHKIKKGKVLEIGCGNGRICIPLAKKGFDVTGIDISPIYIEDAEKKARKHRVKVKFITGDMRNLTKIFKKEKFDVILNVWTAIGYYDKKTDEKVFKSVYKILKDRGLFLILNCASKEMFLYSFCPTSFRETEKYIILNASEFDFLRSIFKEKWICYEKKGRDLKYIDEYEVKMRIYSHQELIEMVEKAGFKFLKAHRSINSLEPANKFSPVNFVFGK